MTLRRDDLFPVHEPPPGGLALLRQRLRPHPPAPSPLAGKGSAARAWLWGGIPALAAGAAALVLALRPAAPDPLRARLAGDPFAQALGLCERSGAVAVAFDARSHSAVRQVATGNPDVVMYWIDATREAAP
jgi:hypothetical protein